VWHIQQDISLTLGHLDSGCYDNKIYRCLVQIGVPHLLGEGEGLYQSYFLLSPCLLSSSSRSQWVPGTADSGQIECQNRCLIGCPRCQTGCQIECQNRMSEHLCRIYMYIHPDEMPEAMNKSFVTVGITRSKLFFSRWRITWMTSQQARWEYHHQHAGFNQ